MPKSSSEEITGLARIVLNHAKHVMKVLGVGHRENIYHKALSTSLNKSHIMHRSEVITPIMFMGECIGVGRADIVLDGVVVEIKAVARCPRATSGQLRKYMESLVKVEKEPCSGVVINFNQNSGEVEIVQELPVIKASRFFQGKLWKRGANRRI